MSRFKRWLVNKYLPTWAKQTIAKENEQLEEQIRQMRLEMADLKGYCDGLETALRAIRRITITNEVKA